MAITPRAFARPSSLPRAPQSSMTSTSAETDHLLVNKKNNASDVRSKTINALIFEALPKLVTPADESEITHSKIFRIGRPCCVNCLITHKRIPVDEFCIRGVEAKENIIVFQTLRGDTKIVAQVMDVKCKYWSLGSESTQLQERAETLSAQTARLHPGNLWNSLLSTKSPWTEKIIDMSSLHLMNCQDVDASDTETPLSLCMQTLKVTQPALVQSMIQKDINEKRRRWTRDSFLRFCS